jgi:hypothetical protein
MWADVPRGFTSLARSGANPFSPDEVVRKICELAQPASRAGSVSIPTATL